MGEGSKLKIRNFGPVKEGYTSDGGYMTFPKVTMICGPQGAGKSSVAKLLSTFSWIEKALVRGDFTIKQLTQYRRFVKTHCAYQRLQNYFSGQTSLHYVGKAFEMKYEAGHLSVEPRDGREYERPQIVYIPAERNLMGVVADAYKMKGAPPALMTMMETYREACAAMKDDLRLPINNARFRYDRLNNVATVYDDGYNVRLNEASSGMQSAVPMYVVMEYLSRLQKNKERQSQTSVKEREKIRKKIETILMDDTVDEETRRLLLKQAADAREKRLLYIVEEPEQNLFPTSQKEVLYKMMEFAAAGNSQLMMTTHSPYLVYYLSLAVKAHAVGMNADDARRCLVSEIVPEEAWIAGDDVAVMEIDGSGSIRQLPKYDGMPVDDNFLNNQLAECNGMFDRLLELEE